MGGAGRPISSVCSKIVELLAKAFSKYFVRRAPIVASYIPITRQPRVKVALRAIARYYEGDEDYPLLSKALEALGEEGFFEYIQEKLGWELVLEGGEKHISIPSDHYIKLVGASQEVFKKLYAGYCYQVADLIGTEI